MRAVRLHLFGKNAMQIRRASRQKAESLDTVRIRFAPHYSKVVCPQPCRTLYLDLNKRHSVAKQSVERSLDALVLTHAAMHTITTRT